MILAAEALLVAAGLVVVRMRPRTAPLPIAVLLALPLLAAAGLGAYGGALLLMPLSQEQKTMASMERSEVLYLAVTPTLRVLGQSAQNLAFPDPGSHSLFADQVVVGSDLDAAPRVEGRLDEAVLSRWPVADGSRSVPKADLALWRPFFSTVEYFPHAKFYIVNARFVDEPETRWQTHIHFAALARLASGALAQVDADLEAFWVRDPAAPQAEPASWRIAELRTKEFKLAEAARPYFDDVLEQVLRDPEDRERARTSLHEPLPGRVLQEQDQAARVFQLPRRSAPFRPGRGGHRPRRARRPLPDGRVREEHAAPEPGRRRLPGRGRGLRAGHRRLQLQRDLRGLRQ